MWSENSQVCENNCQCSGLITENFKINSGNSGTKRKQDEAHATNFKVKMNPHSLNFSPTQSPKASTSKRRILGEIQNSPLFRPKVSPVIERLMSTPVDRLSPLIDRTCSPVTSRVKRSTTKISRIFEERSRYKMDKENIGLISETFVKLDVEEETRDCTFGENFQTTKTSWSSTKLDFTDTLPTKLYEEETAKDIFVPENDTELDSDHTLHDLDEEFDCDNFDQCTKYEIISTDSPNIISRGRTTTARKITSRNFSFGAPLADNEQSTSFNRPNPTATRMLNFEDDSFEFTSPAVKNKTNSFSVKKSLKFNETPTKNPLKHERSDSSIGSMSSISSPAPKLIFTSESTTSMESGFISELEEPFLDMEEASNSPKMANLNDLLSGTIKENIITDKDFMRRPLQRSLSFNPECKARVSLYSILENPEKRTQKRVERMEGDVVNKKRRTNPEVERVKRPVLQRAFSENNASIMSALARSVEDEDLIGDFTLPFALPLTSGEHSDLKSISCDTLAGLLTGQFEHCISDFQVIDCRYPYEFEGGHILGAVNMHTPAQVLTLVNKPLQPKGSETKRSILVFHCEFSIERGPKLSRFLRSSDRAKNMEHYPSLHYPEVYLLHEGYRSFYRQHPHLCSPAGYTTMLDPRHKELLKKHRSTPSQNRLQRLL